MYTKEVFFRDKNGAKLLTNFVYESAKNCNGTNKPTGITATTDKMSMIYFGGSN